MLDGSGELLSGFALFPADTTGKVTVTVRVGTSFISVDQARRNINAEIPDHGTSQMQDVRTAIPQTLERTAQITRSAWAEKLDRFALEGATEVQKDIFWTGIAHALQVKQDLSTVSWSLHNNSLQYPSEQHEEGSYYSGYDGKIHKADGMESYTGYSIWVRRRFWVS
jgi:putative alpha-1,2-mannosidase